MNTHELHLGPNGRAAQLQTIIEHDGPASVVLKNEGEAEYLLAIKRNGVALATAPTNEYQVNDQVQVVYNPPDDAETDFEGVAKGNSPAPHPILKTAVDGATSIPATRTLTSAGGGFVAAGIKAGDVLLISEGGLDDGTYVIAEVTSDTVLTIDRDWPTGGLATQDFWVYGRCAVAPHSVQFTVTITGTSAEVLVTDDGNGTLYGLIVPADPGPLAEIHGTIDYFTGKWAIQCDTALKAASDILLTYAESLPVVAGGKISFPISNARHEQPILMYGIGGGDNVKCAVKVFMG